MLMLKSFIKSPAAGSARYCLPLAAVISLAGAFFPSAAQAQNTWVGASTTSNLWSTPENWAGNLVPPVGGTTSLIVTFTGSGNLANTNNLGSGGGTAGTFDLNRLVFDATSGPYVLSGATFQFNTSGGTAPTLQVNSASPITINNNLLLNSSLTLGTFAAGVPIAAAAPIGTLTLNGSITGTSTTDFVTRLNSLTLTGGTGGPNPIGNFLIGGVSGPPASTANTVVTGGTYNVSRVVVGAMGNAGTLRVNGLTTNINAVNEIQVASSGAGTLTLENGGNLSGNGIFLGRSAGLTGNATVTGNGSRLSAGATGALNVAFESNTQSTLTLQDGGSAFAGTVFIGGVASGSTGAAGTIVANGIGRDASGAALSSTLQSTSMIVGSNNTGSLNISNGGIVRTVNDAFVGLNAGSVGSVTIDGAGSAWTVGFVLSLGGQQNTNGGTASVSVTNGGTLTTIAGTNFFSQGSITAAGSTLDLGSIQSITNASGLISLTNSTLTTGSANTNAVFSGVISGSGNNVVNFIGDGITTLGGANIYTGVTNIFNTTLGQVSTLRVNGSTNASGVVNVNDRGVLGGTGTVGNIVEFSGGRISPGQGTGSIGTLNAASLLLNSNSSFAFDLNFASDTSDQIALSGTLSKVSSSASNFNFVFSTTGSVASGMFDTFTLATFAQPADPNARVKVSDLTYTPLGAGLTGTFGDDGQGYWNGQFVVGNAEVPEPGSLILLGMGGVAFLPRLSRRRRSPGSRFAGRS